MSLEGEPQESEPPNKRPRLPKVTGRLALKVLCPDELTKVILGPKGIYKDQIQEESGAKLVFSLREDYFPNTYLRVLAIYADEDWNILQALDPLLAKLVECGDQEQGHSVPEGLELAGKEAGEYIFRLCLPVKGVSGLIGTAGVNIKQLKAETGVKVQIENNIVLGQQMIRIIGRPDQLRQGLEKVNEFVQRDAGTEAYQYYLQQVGFNDAWDQGWQPAAPSRPGPKREAQAAKHAPRVQGAVIRPPGDAHTPVVVRPPGGAVVIPPPGRQGGHGAAGSGDPGVAELADAVASMPEGTADMEYSVSFALPDALREYGMSEDFRYHLEEITGAKMGDDEDPSSGQLSLVGPLLGIYAAHLLLMKKALDVEEEQAAAGASNDAANVEEMQAQIQELKRQLELANNQNKALAAAGAGKSSGGGGKSKGKGKGKAKNK